MKRTIKHLYLVGNWKMNPETLVEAEGLLRSYLPLTKKLHETSIWLAAPSLYVTSLVKLSKGKIIIGTQNIHEGLSGAHTGDISAVQAKSAGARFTVLGHSERRELGETDADINKKIHSALAQGLEIVLCVGEKIRDNDGAYLIEIQTQIKSALAGVESKNIKKIIIAYEPVWAIGKNATGIATPVECLEVSILIRRTISDLYSGAISKKIVVLYGGSASSSTAEEFLHDGGVQGFLLGRASLDLIEMKKLSSLNS